ncbi:MAG: D-lyxose/D-mannose family sugar isomerase [Clostridiales bacterium]|nr:D-lyxose/D-mannose family sugar isomerase [Clostridiales bacterium]
MKQSQINNAIRKASTAFSKHQWFLPPNPKWDVTDFGLGDFDTTGLTSVNLAEQQEYCEKIMYVKHNQVTPNHYHDKKKEDIICRIGSLALQFYSEEPTVSLQVNGVFQDLSVNCLLILQAGERVTLTQGIRHAFWAKSEYAIVGEVSTANDDTNDNFFQNPKIGRFSEIIEDEPAIIKLVSEQKGDLE